MSVIASELGVCSVEGRIAVGFGLLDSTQQFLSSATHSLSADNFPSSKITRYRQGGKGSRLPVAVSLFVLVMLRRVLGF